MQSLVQETGQLWGDRPNRARGVAGLFPVAFVIVLQFVPTHREVDYGLLVRVDMKGVRVCVLLGWDGVARRVHCKD